MIAQLLGVRLLKPLLTLRPLKPAVVPPSSLAARYHLVTRLSAPRWTEECWGMGFVPSTRASGFY